MIEPNFYDSYSFESWLTDKGRLFFDSTTTKWQTPVIENNCLKLNQGFWPTVAYGVLTELCFLDHYVQAKRAKRYLTVTFENLSIEMSSLLLILESFSSFIRLRRADPQRLNNDLEDAYQIESRALESSSTAVLVAVNPRFEGYCLSLSLRQRFLKGLFKCYAIGSLVNLTTPASFLGSTHKTTKALSEGRSLVCRRLAKGGRATLALNCQFTNRRDGQASLKMLNDIDRSSKGSGLLNLLSPTLHEVGMKSLKSPSCLKKNDFMNSSLHYFLGIVSCNNSHLKGVGEAKLLGYSLGYSALGDSLYIDQTVYSNSNHKLLKQALGYAPSGNLLRYFYLPHSMFYENSETFITAEGRIKQTSKLTFERGSESNWFLLRKLGNLFKSAASFSTQKNMHALTLEPKNSFSFKNFIYFQYLATKSLEKAQDFLLLQNTPFSLPRRGKFKRKTEKAYFTPTKYWLDDFFVGGKDEYSKDSFGMSHCSRNQRCRLTTFYPVLIT